MRTLFAVTILILMTSCQDPIKVKLDQGKPLLVVDAFLNNEDTIQRIRLTQSDFFLNSGNPPSVPNATVTVRNINKNQKIYFTYASNGYYEFFTKKPDTFFITGHSYQLDVLLDNSSYTSHIVQKRKAILDSIQPIFYPNGLGFGNNKPTYSPYLWARDPVDNQTDYYWVKTYRNDTLFNNPGDINIAVDGTNGPVSKDEAGNLDTILFTPPITFLGFKPYASGSKVKVRILSIDQRTYDFLRQVQTQTNNSGLFATAPENVKTNIITSPGASLPAVGWFCVSSVVTGTRVIP